MAKTALVVDDSPTMRMMVSDSLHSAGFDVIEGKNGEDALSQVADRKVHLVITDFNMPVMGGIDLITRLRSIQQFRFIPILVLTTETDDVRKKQGKSAGATGWVTKPFNPSQLIQVVNRLVT